MNYPKIHISQFNGGFEDWAGLLRLIHSAFAYMQDRIDPPSSLHALTREAIEQKAKESTLLLAWDENELVGCVFLDELEAALYIGKLAIAPDHQGSGIGKALIEASKQLAIQTGRSVLELETRIELIENQAFFASQGFMKTGETAHEGYKSPTSVTMQYAFPL